MAYQQHSRNFSCPEVMFYLNLLQSCSLWMEHTGACFVVGRERSMRGDTHHCSAADRGTGGYRNRWNNRGFLASAVSQKLHSAKKRGAEENVTLGFIPHPPKSAIVLGWEQDPCAKGSATRFKCHQSCGSTSLRPALLRDHCGQWKGRRNFPGACGWGKGDPSCWERTRCADNSETSFPWNKGLCWVRSAGGRRAVLPSKTPPRAQRCLWLQPSRRGDCHTLTFTDEPLNTCHLPPAGSNYLTERRIKTEKIIWKRLWVVFSSQYQLNNCLQTGTQKYSYFF